MSVIVKGGGGSGQKVIIDGIEYKGDLKLSTKYQWVDGEPIDFSEYKDVYSVGKRFINFKNETHIFTSASSNNHFKLVDGVLVADVDRPAGALHSGYSRCWACTDDNYIYTFGYAIDDDNTEKMTAFRFDGNTWEKIAVIPWKAYTASNPERVSNAGILSVHSNKLYLSVQTRTTSGSTDYYYAGYIDLSTKGWVELPTLPSNSMYYCSAFTEIDGILYLIGDIDTYNHRNIGFYMLNASSNSWTSLNVKTPFSSIDFSSFDLLTVDNKAYFTISKTFCYFDGSDIVKLVSITKNYFVQPSLLFNNEFTLYGEVTESVSRSSSVYVVFISNSIQMFKKVLFLEV